MTRDYCDKCGELVDFARSVNHQNNKVPMPNWPEESTGPWTVAVSISRYGHPHNWHLCSYCFMEILHDSLSALVAKHEAKDK